MDVVCIENTDTEEECYECGKTLPDVPFLARVRLSLPYVLGRCVTRLSAEGALGV